MEVPQHKRPLWLGVLLASLAPPTGLIGVILFTGTDLPSAPEVLSTVSLAYLVAFPIALIAMLTLGLPFVLWLRSHNSLNTLSVCAGAAIIGAVSSSLLTMTIRWDHQFELAQLLYGAGFGLTAGIAFCLGAGPNNSFKPNPHRGGA
jgi:hypothetical protein